MLKKLLKEIPASKGFWISGMVFITTISAGLVGLLVWAVYTVVTHEMSGQ